MEKQLKYPILMVHGMGFRDRKYLNYWGRIPAALESAGCQIFYGNQDSNASIETNALVLRDKIFEIMMTIVGNDGTVYVLIKDTGFDSGSAMAKYFKLVRENADKKDRVQLAMKTILKNSGDYGLIYKKGRKKL